MSEIRNRFDNSKNEEASDKGLIDESDVSVADLGETVDNVNDGLNTLIAASTEHSESLEGLKDMTKSMYVSDNEESESESENGVEGESENGVENHSENEKESEYSDSETEATDESEPESESESKSENDNHECNGCDAPPHYSKIIFVPVKQQKDDGIPGLIIGVASLLIFAWTMRALCIICAIGSNTCPNMS